LSCEERTVVDFLEIVGDGSMGLKATGNPETLAARERE
jgi:hypothetical protein